jgi:hypothetical protein
MWRCRLVWHSRNQEGDVRYATSLDGFDRGVVDGQVVASHTGHGERENAEENSHNESSYPGSRSRASLSTYQCNVPILDLDRTHLGRTISQEHSHYDPEICCVQGGEKDKLHEVFVCGLCDDAPRPRAIMVHLPDTATQLLAVMRPVGLVYAALVAE